MAIKKDTKSHSPSTPQPASKKKKNDPTIFRQGRSLALDNTGTFTGKLNRVRPSKIKEAKPSQQNHESFYTLFHANPIPAMLTRLIDNLIMNVNPAFLEYLNLECKDVVGHKVQDLNIFSKEGERSLQGGNLRHHEQIIMLPDGEKKTMLTFAQRVHVENTDAALSTFIDITDRVQVEQQIRNVNIERASAELNERRRIAQLLHDDLQQRIFAVKMHLERLKDGFANHDVEAAKEDFSKLDAWLIEAIAITRKLSSDINPFGISGSTLPEGILWLAAEMKEQYGLETRFEGNGIQPKLDSNVLSILLQAMRELLFNVIKHAGTRKAAIRLEKEGYQSLQIIVSDDGKGFDMKKIRRMKSISGLTNIRHQLNIFGCTLELTSTHGNGTRAIIGVPLRNSGLKP